MNHEDTKHTKVYRSISFKVLFVPSWFDSVGRH
jgi:hypothetical protein